MSARGTVVMAALLSCNLAMAADVLIRDATVHTLVDPAPLEQADVLIRDGRIAAVGVDLAAGDASVIEARGWHVTPGLVSAYTNLGIVEIDRVALTADLTTLDTQYGASFRVTPVLNPYSELLAANRAQGLTHAVVAPESGHSIFAGQGAVVNLAAGVNFVVVEDVAVFAGFNGTIKTFAGGSRASAFARLHQALLDAIEFDSHRDQVRRGAWREFSLPLHELEALVPVARGQKLLVVTSHRVADLEAMLGLQKELGLKLVLAGATEAWRIADRIAAAGVPVIMDTLANLPADFDRLGARSDAAALLHQAGVTILLRSVEYMGTHNAYLVRQVAGNAVAWGMPHEEAIRAMTQNPARVFGFEDRHGTIKAGMPANLVVWDGDPLELLTGVEHVFVDGEPVSLESRATRLRERYRDLETPAELIYRH